MVSCSVHPLLYTSADFHSHNKANKIEKMSSTFRQKEIDMFLAVEAFWKYNHKVVVCAETKSSVLHAELKLLDSRLLMEKERMKKLRPDKDRQSLWG